MNLASRIETASYLRGGDQFSSKWVTVVAAAVECTARLNVNTNASFPIGLLANLKDKKIMMPISEHRNEEIAMDLSRIEIDL